MARNVFVTGATSGIGFVLPRRMPRYGDNVFDIWPPC